MAIRAVWFDVGEVLVDETRVWGAWADWIGVPRHTFSAVFGAVIASGRDFREIFEKFRPGFDPAAERRARLDAGVDDYLVADDLYPDVRPCLERLRARGLFVGIAGNQPEPAGPLLRHLQLPVDVVATSTEWGVVKPAPEFFARLIAASGHRPDEILYVGDRLDNDVTPAAQAGLRTAWIRRGPWAHIMGEIATRAGATPSPDVTIGSLAELDGVLARRGPWH